ncbi:efflux RND transporter permease subunit [Arenicella xantha]|uniref:Multidrug efflux pump subunit AcrB n=1 Tax=Arenicella xantha TaxID=644221 RepID=A0A395JL18_9GAMM|nr:efflux RND transporter permease subunit [Arenicella xantha]RBP51125.1 multidrug efflux pump subunit AcrB [Arenicella xantha]
MIEWFARNSVAANLLMITILLAGAITLSFNLKLEIFPTSDPESISVSVSLRGATPEDMELGVAVRIEEALQGLAGIDEIRSNSREGSVSISIEVNEDYDPREILDDVKNRVDAISTLPSEAERPVIALAQRRREVISVAVTTEYGEQETRLLAEQVREDLLRIDGISQVELDSVRGYEIAIEVSQDKLRRFNLTISDVANAISADSQDMSAGNVRTVGGDILLRSKGQAYRYADFANIVVKADVDGAIVRVSDVATVNDGFQEEALLARFNGEVAAMIDVYRTEEEDSIAVAKSVRDYIDLRQASLPTGAKIEYWDDDSKALKSRLSTLGSSALQGGLLVIILLALFLRPAVAFWVTLGIPVTFMGALAVIDLMGVSINVMSLFGFITVLGIVVDDAIVTGESVYSRLRNGEDGLQASIKGTKSVAVPVTFGILTTVAAFIPISQLEGRLGAIFSPIPAVVIPVLLFSLIESKFILPAHLKHIKIRDPNKVGRLSRWQMNFAQGFEGLILKWYKPALERAIEYRYSVLTGFICLFFIISFSISTGWSRFVFIPSIERDGGQVTLVMPTGTPFEVTDRHMQRFMQVGLELQKELTNGEGGEPIITHIFATTGNGGSSHVASLRFEGIPRTERLVDVSSIEIMQAWRERVGDIPGAESLTFRSRGFSAGEPINIELRGQSFDELLEVSNQLKERLAEFNGVFDIADTLANGKQEIQIELTPNAHLLGLTRNDIVGQVGQAFSGFQAQRIQRGRDDVRVLVRFPKSERSTTDTLQDMLITAPNGQKIPLSNVATLSPGRGPSEIIRIDQYRTVTVSADVDKEATNMTVINREIDEFLEQVLAQHPNVRVKFTGEAEEQRKAFSSVTVSLLVLIFAIYVLLALPLKSYGLPLAVMSVIPFSLVGGVLGHWLMGIPISLLSILGLLALLGVVINDSLVLVDYIRQLRMQGSSLLDAVRQAGVSRFRPVLLTSLTTFFGLIPLTFISKGDVSAAFLQPMAVSLSFGILFATVITLFFVPINLLVARDVKRLLANRFGRDETPDAMVSPHD